MYFVTKPMLMKLLMPEVSGRYIFFICSYLQFKYSSLYEPCFKRCICFLVISNYEMNSIFRRLMKVLTPLVQ